MTTSDLTLKDGTIINIRPIKSLEELLHGVRKQEQIDKVLIILLDTSGSMGEPIESQAKIEVAWDVLRNELMPRMERWNYGVITFGEGAVWTVYPARDTRALVAKSRPGAFGGTSMLQALRMAWDWVRMNAKQARFILLSDGCPTDARAADILQTANTSIPIDTVGIGGEDRIGHMAGWGYDKEFLQELSRITGGVFVEAHSVKMLAETIEKLSPAQRPLLGEVK